MEKQKKLLNAVILSPLIAAPVLAVEFPRLLAYTPILSAILGAIVFIACFKQTIKPPKILVIFTLTIMALVGVSLLWSSSIDVSMERAVKLLVLLPLYALFLAVLNHAKTHLTPHAMSYMLISCGCGAALTGLDIVLDGIIYRTIRQIPLEEFKSTAVFNRGAVVCVLLSLAAYISNPKINKKTIVIASLPLIGMLFLIQSQSAQLAVIVALIFHLFFPVAQKWAWLGFFSVVAVFMLGQPFIVQALHHHMPQYIHELPMIRDAYLWSRFEIWDFVARSALEKPWLGQGLEITKTLENEFSFATQSILHPHNFILQIWIELGALGIVTVLILIGGFLCFIYQNLSPLQARVILTSFVTCFAVACFAYGMWQGWWLGLLYSVAGIHIISTKHKA